MKRTIYIVQETGYDGNEVVWAYSDEDAAHTHARQMNVPHGRTFDVFTVDFDDDEVGDLGDEYREAGG